MLKLILVAVVAYACIVALVYALQTRMLFPARLVSTAAPVLPDQATELEVVTPDSVRLRGIRIPPTKYPGTEPVTVLGFGGNAWNADYTAIYLHDLFPENEVIVFHYRGYGSSTGRPGAERLQFDSLLIFDHLQNMAGIGPAVAIGFSIGSGVAAHLASKRPVAGLILVSPFDSLKNLAAEHYPWLPVRWLLRHHMEPAQAIRNVSAPTAVIGAQHDTVVPPRRTEAVRQAVPNLVLDRTIDGAGHNDLYDRTEFRSAIVEAFERIETGLETSEAIGAAGISRQSRN